MAKIVATRNLKNGKTINVLANSKKYEDLEKYGVVFRHLKPSSKSRKSRSSRFLQDIEVVDENGNKIRVRVYAKNPEHVEAIEQAIKSGKIKIAPETESKAPEVLSAKMEDEKDPEKDVLKFTAQNTKLSAAGENKEDIEKNQEFLNELTKIPGPNKSPKLLPYDESKGLLNSGYVVIEIPVQNSDQKVKYQVSRDKEGPLKAKIENNLIVLSPTEQLEVVEPVTPQSTDVPEGTVNPVEPKPTPTKELEKTDELTPKPEKRPEAVVEDPSLSSSDKTSKTMVTDVSKPEDTKLPKVDCPQKPKKHIFRKIMQGVLVGLIATVSIPVGLFTGGIGFAGIVGAVFAAKGFKKSNIKLEEKEQAEYMEQYRASAKENPELLEDLSAEQKLQMEMEIEQEKIDELNRRKTIATKRKEREALEAEVNDLEMTK